MATTFTPEQDAALADLLATTEYVDASPTEDTDPDNGLPALAERLAGIGPWDPGFEDAVDEAIAAVRANLDGEVRDDTVNALQALLLVNWGLPPEEAAVTASAAGQHWKDELRIPKGNGDHSGQWTFTPWKWMDTLQAEAEKVGKVIGVDDIEEYNAKVRAKLDVARTVLNALDKDEASTHPGDPIVTTSSAVAGQLFLDAAVAANDMGLPSKNLEEAAKSTLAFGKYDWTLFDESSDIGANDPDEDFGELLTEDTDIGAGDIPDNHQDDTPVAEDVKKAKDLKPGDTVVTYDEEGSPYAVVLDDVQPVADTTTGEPQIEVTDQDGASWNYGPDDEVEIMAGDDEAENAAALNEDVGPSKTAKDLKPGDQILVGSEEDDTLAFTEVSDVQVGADGVIEVTDIEGLTYHFAPDQAVSVEPADDDLEDWEKALLAPDTSGAVHKDAKDLKVGDLFWDGAGHEQSVKEIHQNHKGQVVVTDGNGAEHAFHPEYMVPMSPDSPAALPPKKAGDIVAGDTVMVHDFPVEVAEVALIEDPWGGKPYVQVTSTGEQTYGFDPDDDVPLVKAAPEAKNPSGYEDPEDVPVGTSVWLHDAASGDEPEKYTKVAENAWTSDGLEEDVELTDGVMSGGWNLVVAPPEPVPAATRADFLGAESFTPAEKAAVKAYGMPHGYKTVNPYLNNNGQVYDTSIPGLRPATAQEKAFAEKTIKDLDSAFGKAAPLDHEVTVVRRSGAEQFGTDPLAPGDTFTNAAYLSTALPGGKKNGYGYESKPVQWEITLPKGAKALQGNAHENEILLPRGSRFVVESDTTDASGLRHLKVRVVLEKPKPVGDTGGYASAADVPVGESVLLLPVESGGTPVKYTKVGDDEWSSVDPKTGEAVTDSDADLAGAWDTLFTQEEGAPVTPGMVEVDVPIVGKEIQPGDTLDLSKSVILKKSGGKLVQSTGVNPTVAEVKHGPKWANVVTTTGQKLWVPTDEPITAKRKVAPSTTTYPTTSLLPGDTLTLDGPVLKKSAGKLVPAEGAKQGKHDESPVIATIKHGPKWTEVTTTSGQKLWIQSGTEVTAQRVPGAATPGAVTPAVKGSGEWKNKPAPVAPPEPVEPQAGVPQKDAFDAWLVAVKERYAANPNKAKGSLEESANWPKVQSILNGDPALAKTAIDSLHKNQYLDDDLRAQAEKIYADAAVIKPGEFEKYAKAHAAWKQAMEGYEADLAAWQKDNPTSLKGMSGAKVFTSNEAGVAWANKTLKVPIPDDAKEMVKSMKGSSGYVNGQLWNNGGAVPASVQTHVASLDKAMTPLPEDIYLFRGTNMNEFKGIGSVEDLKKAVGTTFVQHAYQPTGLGVDTAFSGSPVQIVYRAPKGTLGVWARPISPPPFSAEREYMLGRNTKYFIHKVTQKNGQTFVEAEIIPPGHPDPSGQPGQGLTHKVGTHFARLRLPA